MSVFVDFHSSAVRVLCVQLSSGKEVKSIACKIIVRNYLVWIIALYCLLYVPAVKTSQVTIQYWINETNSFCVLVYLISTISSILQIYRRSQYNTTSTLQIYRRRPCVNIYTLKIYWLFKQRIQAPTMKMGRIFKKIFFQILK